MHIAIHLGVHCTDDERLLRCLHHNSVMLAANDVAVPDPDLYRYILRDASKSLGGAPASPDTESLMLEQILDDARPQRVVLSWDTFLSFPQWALRSRLYPNGADRVRELHQTFPSHDVEFFMAIRNPATFLPELCSRIRNKSVEDIMSGCDVLQLRWSDLIEDILSRHTGARLTLWCDEDTPLIWPEVLAAVAGIGDGTKLEGWDDLLQHLLDEEGVRRLRSLMEEQDLQDLHQRRRVIANLLTEFVRPEATEMEFEMPGWSQAVVDDLTQLYEEDVERIRAMNGVYFIAP